MTFIEKLQAEQAQLFNDNAALVALIEKEERALTDDEKAANEKRFTRASEIESTIGDLTKFAKIAIQNGTAELPKPPAGKTEFDGSQGKGEPREEVNVLDLSDADKRRYSRELSTFAATGVEGPISRRFATITTTTGSGILLPRTIASPIIPTNINPFRAAHTILGMKPVETTTTADMYMPVLDSTAGGIVAENASTETENGGIGESAKLTPKTFQSGSAWFSNQALAANDFDILTNVVPGLTYNKELALESAIAAALIADSGITQSVTAASTTSVSYGNMVTLNNALPARYDSMKCIVLGRDAFSYQQGLVGSDGHPVLLMDPQNQSLARFNGTPVLRSDYFEAFGTSKTLGVIFSLLGFKLRDVTVQNLARYVNFPNRPNQTGLNLFAYHGYGWAVSAVAKLKT